MQGLFPKERKADDYMKKKKKTSDGARGEILKKEDPAVSDGIIIPEPHSTPVAILRTDGQNPNVLLAEKMDALKKNIQKFGFLIPIITNDEFVIADGEHRLQAAKELGMEKVPVIHLPIKEVDRKILRQVMNKLHGEHDPELDIKEYLRIQEEEGIKLLAELTGTKETEYLDILRADQPDNEKEDNFNMQGAINNPKYLINQGDVWQLGPHTLLCADTTDPEQSQAILDFAEAADTIFIDPPYNLAFSGTDDKFDTFENDDLEDPEYETFASKIITNTLNLSKPDANIHVCIDYRNHHVWTKTLKDHKKKIFNTIVWDKVYAGLGHRYRQRHEFIIFAGTKDSIWLGSTTDENIITLKENKPFESNTPLDMKGVCIPIGENQYIRIKTENEPPARVPVMEKEEEYHFKVQGQGTTDVWQGYSMSYFSQRELEQSEGIIHPTMKPIRLIADLIKNTTRPGQTVLDTCAGSGSTLIAATQTQNPCNVIEIDPRYCSAIIQRWEEFTKNKANKISENFGK